MTFALLIVATVAVVYYALTLIAGRWARAVPVSMEPVTRFAILVPAHNEELSLPATLASLVGLDYPRHLFAVHVIADNCTDATAAVARAHGVAVIERHDAAMRGKGHALHDALETLVHQAWDTVLIFDADGAMAPDTLRRFDARLQAGAAVVQGSIRTRNAADSPASLVAAVGNVLDDAMSAGRGALGLRVPLRGTMMAITRATLARCPWHCHGLTEDAEYSQQLARCGIRVAFEPRARARSESAASMAALAPQRRRWRAALAHPLRWLDSKPLVMLELVAATLAVMSAPQTFTLVWCAAIWCVTLAIYSIAILQIPEVNWRHIVAAPAIVIRLAVITAAGLFVREPVWQRTRRVAEAEPAA